MSETEYISIMRYYWLDASALVKLVTNEKGSNRLSRVFNSFSGVFFFTTFLCYAEAMSVLKRKYSKKAITNEQYFKGIFLLQNWINLKKIRLPSIDEHSVPVFIRVREIADKYKMDFSDALVFTAMTTGFHKMLGGKSKPILIASDKKMLKAATGENISTWNPEEDSAQDPLESC